MIWTRGKSSMIEKLAEDWYHHTHQDFLGNWLDVSEAEKVPLDELILPIRQNLGVDVNFRAPVVNVPLRLVVVLSGWRVRAVQ
jgi:hypothetical protein